MYSKANTWYYSDPPSYTLCGAVLPQHPRVHYRTERRTCVKTNEDRTAWHPVTPVLPEWGCTTVPLVTKPPPYLPPSAEFTETLPQRGYRVYHPPKKPPTGDEILLKKNTPSRVVVHCKLQYLSLHATHHPREQLAVLMKRFRDSPP